MTTSTSAPPKKRTVRGWLPHKSVLVVQGSQGDSWLVSMRLGHEGGVLVCNCPAFEFKGDCPHLTVAAEYLERPAFRKRMAQPNAREVSPEAHKMYILTHSDPHRIIARREARMSSGECGDLRSLFAE